MSQSFISSRVTTENMNFEELGLDKGLATRLAGHGIVSPSIIQQEAFPIIRAGESIIALSKTGTGKTLAYLAPLVQRYTLDLPADETAAKTWALVLVPTRELADQASKNLRLLTDNQLQSVVIVGGESEKKQVSDGATAALYVATPGRFLDLLQRKQVNVSALKCVVFDEADRILDMGFIDDIRAIRKLLPTQLQLCFFSATIHFGIDEMSYEFGVNAQRIGKEADELTVEGLDHRVAFVGDQEKFHALVNFLKLRPKNRGIVFTNYRDSAHMLVSRLKGLGLRTESLTAQLSQSERTRTMQQFRDEKIQVLIASDLASRGLDVDDLDFVVNVDLPEDPATYVHRVGRTARAGKQGIALSLVGFDDSFRLERLEKFLGKSIARFEFAPEELSGHLPRFGDRLQSAPRQDAVTGNEDSSRIRDSSREPRREHRNEQRNGNRGPSRDRHERRPTQHAQGAPRPHRHETRPQSTRPQNSSQPRPVHTHKHVASSAPQKSLWDKAFASFLKLFGLKKNPKATTNTMKK